MSILLEALRKSEKNQRSHEVPTIHADDQSDPVKDSFKIGPLAILLVAAMFVSGWLIWRQYYVPADSYQPTVALEADEDRAVAASVAAAGESSQTNSEDTTSDHSVPRKRTPVESYQQVLRGTSQQNPGSSGAATENAPDQSVKEASQSRSTVSHLANVPDTQSTLDQTGDKVSTPPASYESGSGAPVAAIEIKQDPRETSPISYWELPDAIRNDVPEIKFNVLVYANNPADRFVLMNGQRLGEGDSAQPGLVVKEIRLDGVVFSYRLYQFLVER